MYQQDYTTIEESEDFVFQNDYDSKYLSEFLEGVIEQLFGEGELDVCDLHHCLNELCVIAGLSAPKGDIKVERSVKPLSTTVMSSWLEFNKKYTEGLVTVPAV